MPTLREYLAACEREYLCSAMESSGWNARKAAEMLGISRSTLNEKLSFHQIARDRPYARKGAKPAIVEILPTRSE